ncbi:MAG: cob(I)yrinic acid a,c-diamide adenosyltransferase [Candidatus Bipolaricaulota bacterium]|nr:MAG: cob(I)yrinic acid a,c-diamide adenosyltransferase [Candidatus Bipolaricaulota bacterium]
MIARDTPPPGDDSAPQDLCASCCQAWRTAARTRASGGGFRDGPSFPRAIILGDVDGREGGRVASDESAVGEGRGRVNVFWGDGKGKTSAALGMAVRALGRGLRVHLVTFLKDPEASSGEFAFLDGHDGFSREAYGASGLLDGRPGASASASARRGLEAALRAVRAPGIDVVILDEVLYAVSLGVLATQDVLELIDAKLPASELVLTGGWQAHPGVIEAADLVTELRKGKHPFDDGAAAREGFEY